MSHGHSNNNPDSPYPTGSDEDIAHLHAHEVKVDSGRAAKPDRRAGTYLCIDCCNLTRLCVALGHHGAAIRIAIDALWVWRVRSGEPLVLSAATRDRLKLSRKQARIATGKLAGSGWFIVERGSKAPRIKPTTATAKALIAGLRAQAEGTNRLP